MVAEDIYLLAERLGFDAECLWTPQQDGLLDVLFVRQGLIPSRCLAELSMSMDRKLWDTVASRPRNSFSNKDAAEMGLMFTAYHGLEMLLRAGASEDDNGGSDDFGRWRGDEEALRQHCMVTLPEYMCPSTFLFLETMPLTDNGKVDRKRLPKPGTKKAVTRSKGDDWIVPTGDIEEALAAMYGQLLDLSPIGAHDDFFALGGHSLLAMQLLRQIDDQLSVRISLRDFADVESLRELADLVDMSLSRKSERKADRDYDGDAARSKTSPSAGVTICDPMSLPFVIAEPVKLMIPVASQSPAACHVAGRLWGPRLPSGSDVSEARPCVIEQLPYRSADKTRQIDSMNYPWLAGQGYMGLRVDSRGTGNSGGVMEDEYSQLELDDLHDVMDWVVHQPWSNGEVFLMGVSYSGILSLAYLSRPPMRRHKSLKGVIAVCATDDCYLDVSPPSPYLLLSLFCPFAASHLHPYLLLLRKWPSSNLFPPICGHLIQDMHYMGGVPLVEQLCWGANFQSSLSLPPTPGIMEEAGQDWKAIWTERLQSCKPILTK